MLKSLYTWTLTLAARPSAAWWLAIIAFLESSIFLVPADVLLMPMILSRPHRAWRYALLATVFSVLGGIAGWFIGRFAFESIARPVLAFYGKLDTFEQLSASVDYKTILLLLITSGLAHLPPIKVVTILAGVVNVSLGTFVASAVITRGGRFLLIAWLLNRYGEAIRDFIKKRLGLLSALAAAALIGLYGLYKLMH